MPNETEYLNISLGKARPFQPDAPQPLPFPMEESWIFRGEPGNPLLAPRGVCVTDTHLIVSDTAQNRVFIWKKPETGVTELPADLVLGQVLAGDTGRNASGEITANSLHYPSGVWSDGERLIVADAWNHRVLIWLRFPTENGQAADVVLGQPGFETGEPNVAGIGSEPSANTLNWPYGVFSDGTRLFIADTGNRRVLGYHQIPESSFAPADFVIGKQDFVTRDYEPEDAIWPYSVKLSPQGALAITDTQYFRVLLWPNWEDAVSQKAPVLIGQPQLQANGMNQYRAFPGADTLNWCYDSCFWQEGLLVADTGNSRVLWFDQLPVLPAEAATGLIGKPDFYTGSENADTILGTASSLYWPFSLSTTPQFLAIADTGNHRLFLAHLSPKP